MGHVSSLLRFGRAVVPFEVGARPLRARLSATARAAGGRRGDRVFVQCSSPMPSRRPDSAAPARTSHFRAAAASGFAGVTAVAAAGPLRSRSRRPRVYESSNARERRQVILAGTVPVANRCEHVAKIEVNRCSPARDSRPREVCCAAATARTNSTPGSRSQEREGAGDGSRRPRSETCGHAWDKTLGRILVKSRPQHPHRGNAPLRRAAGRAASRSPRGIRRGRHEVFVRMKSFRAAFRAATPPCPRLLEHPKEVLFGSAGAHES